MSQSKLNQSTDTKIEDSSWKNVCIIGGVAARRSLIFQAVSQICNPHMYWFPGS